MPKKSAQKKTVKKVAKPAAKKTVKKTVKKVSKKAASPKATKKVVRKNVPKKGAGCGCKKTCESHECFWVNNGPVVDSLTALKAALKEMSDDQYHYHTRRNGNDFALWIEACLSDKTCAVRVSKAKTRSGAVRALSCSCK